MSYTNQMQDSKLSSLISESRVSAVCDTGCTITVCGGQWLGEYLKTLTEYDTSLITEEKSAHTFSFGDGKKFISLKRMCSVD